VGVLGGATVTCAQPRDKPARIGILGSSGRTADMVGPQPRGTTKALLDALRELGYVWGEHFVTEVRGGEGKPERFPSLAAELVRLQVDVIVAAGPTLSALKQTTSTIPVVMAVSGDPVGEGLVESLARPGRNFTGLSSLGVEVTGKRLQVLKEIVPGPGPIAVVWHRSDGVRQWQAAEAVGRARGWALLSLEIRDTDRIEDVFKAATAARASALYVIASAPLFGRAREVAALAAKSRLPAMYSHMRYVEEGGLMSYGVDIRDIWRRAAVYVDKILKGAKPADLPVEQPTKLDLVINLKAAKALGLAIQPSVLIRADRIIE